MPETGLELTNYRCHVHKWLISLFILSSLYSDVGTIAILVSTAEEVLGKQREKIQPWVTNEVLDLCSQRRQLKQKVHCRHWSRTGVQKGEQRSQEEDEGSKSRVEWANALTQRRECQKERARGPTTHWWNMYALRGCENESSSTILNPWKFVNQMFRNSWHLWVTVIKAWQKQGCHKGLDASIVGTCLIELILRSSR